MSANGGVERDERSLLYRPWVPIVSKRKRPRRDAHRRYIAQPDDETVIWSLYFMSVVSSWLGAWCEYGGSKDSDLNPA